MANICFSKGLLLGGCCVMCYTHWCRCSLMRERERLYLFNLDFFPPVQRSTPSCVGGEWQRSGPHLRSKCKGVCKQTDIPTKQENITGNTGQSCAAEWHFTLFGMIIINITPHNVIAPVFGFLIVCSLQEISIHPFASACPFQGRGGCWSLSQLS